MRTSALSFSPRAWGWSGQVTYYGQYLTVLPTCVGMVRSLIRVADTYSRSPHVRGDGPRVSVSHPIGVEFSPRAWGWSVINTEKLKPLQVLPTCVGMVRCPSRCREPLAVLPTCGDGPPVPCIVLDPFSFSPRAWGWSVRHRWDSAEIGVLPTCVGMVRTA